MIEPIVLAVFPSVPQALPALERALAGSGAPGGILCVRRAEDGIVVEWDPGRSAVRLVMSLIDAELQRYGSGRRIELLVPLSERSLAAIAAAELQAAEIAPDRILETLLAKAGLC